MKLRCIAIDDEPLALKQMCSYIERTPFLELVAACKDGFEGLEKIHMLSPDLLFVDVDMPGLNGMELVKSLTGKYPVIFTTAYDEYAVEGFRVNAIDYLLKPISYADFLKAAGKAGELLTLKHTASETLSGNDECLFVKSEYRIVRIRFNEIKYIEGMREYIRIHLTEGKPIMTLLSMKAVEERLPGNRFMRIHRSFIVNLDKINIIERSRIVFDKDTYIPVGEQYKEAFQHFVDKNFM